MTRLEKDAQEQTAGYKTQLAALEALTRALGLIPDVYVGPERTGPSIRQLSDALMTSAELFKRQQCELETLRREAAEWQQALYNLSVASIELREDHDRLVSELKALREGAKVSEPWLDGALVPPAGA